MCLSGCVFVCAGTCVCVSVHVCKWEEGLCSGSTMYAFIQSIVQSNYMYVHTGAW